ncbi:hypothetical protein [Bradyrhizobium sp. RDM4]|uniref:hypothetical protein n=1 Tax=Bradyrhizobium sp. RDM4 TaxID=3378765 RepID=UPI0038FD04E7
MMSLHRSQSCDWLFVALAENARVAVGVLDVSGIDSLGELRAFRSCFEHCHALIGKMTALFVRNAIQDDEDKRL